MNTRGGRTKFKNFRIILDSRCISKILIRSLVEKLCPEKDDVMQWQKQAGNTTTNFKVKIDFTLPALSAKNAVTWKFHIYDSAKGRYDMILGRYLLISLGLNLELSKHVTKVDYGTFKGSTAPMVDLGAYIFRYLNIGKTKPEESFIDAYSRLVYYSEHVSTATKLLRLTLDEKYEKTDLHKVMETQCQNLMMIQHNYLL